MVDKLEEAFINRNGELLGDLAFDADCEGLGSQIDL